LTVDIDGPETRLEPAPEELADGGVGGQAVELCLAPETKSNILYQTFEPNQTSHLAPETKPNI
jgi:hypothetical protein